MKHARNPLFEAVRLGLFASALAGLGAGFPAVSMAQADDQDEEVAEEVEAPPELDRVTVTGSRIERPGLDTFYPAITVDSQLLEDRAFTNIADALNEIPTFGNPPVTPRGTQGFATLGQNFVNFLDLGAQRTLTLVNNRRFVTQNLPTIFGTSGGLQVDFNVIPIALVDRIETIGIGGAPIYGSDAIAGTINVITKDRFEGLEFTGRKGVASKGDFDFEQASLVAGANTFDGRGNVTFSAEWFRQDGEPGTARPRFSEGDNDVFFGIDADGVARIFENLRINIFTFGGLIHPLGFGVPQPGGEIPIPSFGIGAFPDGNFYQFDSNSNLVPFTPGAPGPGSAFFALGGDGPDFFDILEQFQSPLSRGVFTTSFNYDISDSVRLSSDFLMGTSSAEELARQVGFQTGAFAGTSGALVFSNDHPFLPQQARDVLDANGVDQFVMSRFHLDIIDPRSFRDQNVWRWTGGLDGDFFIGDRRFNWEAYVVHGETNAETREEGVVDGRLLNAIDVRVLTAEDLELVDPLDLAAIGGQGTVSVGDFVCEAVFQAALDPSFGAVSGTGVTANNRPFVDGCIPLNLFGEGARSEAARAWVTGGDRITTGNMSQTVWNANIGGELFHLPAGPFAMNVGYEGRRETAIFRPGLGTVVPLTRSSPFAETGGEFDTDEIFAEAVAPIFSPDMNIPGLHLLEINGAYRNIDNSIAGSDDVWTVGGRWAPVRDLTFRGNYTESIRSPSLVELFAPRNQAFSFAADPCDQRFVNQGPVPDTRRRNCEALGIDPDDFISNIVNATAVGTTGGNPNLTNEKAEAWSVGFTFEPRWVDNLIISADHFDVAIEEAITVVGLTQLMTACFDSENFPNPACDAFTRDENFQVVDFEVGQTNAQRFEIEVTDLNIDYRFDLARPAGWFSDNLADSNLGTFRINPHISRLRSRETSVIGEEIASNVRGFARPRYQGTLDFSWARNNTRLFWRTAWQNRARLSPAGTREFQDREGNTVTSTRHRFINNFSISHVLPQLFPGAPEELIVQLNVDNVLRRMPNEVEQAAGHFGFAELVGRSYTFSIRGRY